MIWSNADGHCRRQLRCHYEIFAHDKQCKGFIVIMCSNSWRTAISQVHHMTPVTKFMIQFCHPFQTPSYIHWWHLMSVAWVYAWSLIFALPGTNGMTCLPHQRSSHLVWMILKDTEGALLAMLKSCVRCKHSVMGQQNETISSVHENQAHMSLAKCQVRVVRRITISFFI